MATVVWNGPACRAMIEKQASGRIRRACEYLSDTIKADISQSGTLRYNPTTKKGTKSKSTKTIYNFTHSRPGSAPFKQTGHLRRSITWEVNGLVGRVGTSLPYGRALELGTGRMRARPFILPAFMKHRTAIASVIQGTIQPGGLPQIESDQSRSGHMGRSGIAAGYI
jgi:phage gpG-like protein